MTAAERLWQLRPLIVERYRRLGYAAAQRRGHQEQLDRIWLGLLFREWSGR